jgi:hypothetical protein
LKPIYPIRINLNGFGGQVGLPTMSRPLIRRETGEQIGMHVESGRLRLMEVSEHHSADARKMALESMVTALEYLDSDVGISPIVGSHLQLAIDRLLASSSESSPIIE